MTGGGQPPDGAATAREEVLRRVRTALGTTRGRKVEVPRAYRRGLYPVGGAVPADVVDVFAERVEDYRATVTRVPPDRLRPAVQAALAAAGVHRLAVAPGVGTAWRPAGDSVELVVDDPPLAVGDLDAVDGALTSCALGIAETG
ncbi:MAG TPA: lactate utilization protein C, partial [Frankiaceae bacterium]|nr:lactate utilization protein C [Frankiaceae bacterium]